jgi:hypothetical protein
VRARWPVVNPAPESPSLRDNGISVDANDATTVEPVEQPQDTDDLRVFTKQAQAALTLQFGELLPAETRTEQRRLVVIAGLLILIAERAIRFSGEVELLPV